MQLLGNTFHGASHGASHGITKRALESGSASRLIDDLKVVCKPQRVLSLVIGSYELHWGIPESFGISHRLNSGDRIAINTEDIRFRSKNDSTTISGYVAGDLSFIVSVCSACRSTVVCALVRLGLRVEIQ